MEARTEDTLRFAELTGERPMIESIRRQKPKLMRMASGKAEFRVVLTMDNA